MTLSLNHRSVSCEDRLFGFGNLDLKDGIEAGATETPNDLSSQNRHALLTAQILKGLREISTEVPKSITAQLRSVSKASDERSFCQGLLAVGQALVSDGKLEQAALVYNSLQGIIPEHLGELKAETNKRLAALSNRGDLAYQAPVLRQQLRAGLTDEVGLGGMVAAQVTFGLSRVGIFRLLENVWKASRVERLAVASGAAFGLEGAALVGAGEGLGYALGHEPVEGEPTLGQKFGHAYLMMGSLRSASGLVGAMVGRHTMAAASPLARMGQIVAPQVGMFGAIAFTHAVAPSLDLGPIQEHLGLASLVTYLHFTAAGLALHAIPGYVALNQKIRVETELAIRGVGQRLYNHLAETFQPPQGPLGSQESLVSANGAPIPIENSKPLQQNVYKTQRHDPPGFEDATPVSIYPSGLRDYGPFGRFVLNTPNTGVRIYGPVQVLERASQAPKRPGVTILISGAGGDHTSLGEGPLQLHRKGRQVRILTIPGYGENEPESILRTPSKTLEKNWYTALSATVKKIMGENPEGPVILGGFSQGSAMAIRVFKGLSPAEQNRVQSLILGAPAFAFTALETKSSLVNWIKRYLYVPYQALMNKTRQRKVPDRLAPELRKDFYVKTKRPWRGEYAAVLSGEAARRDLATIKNPPPTLVIHGGRSDPTVSYKAAELVRQAFGKQAEFLNLEGEDSGHYVFVGEGRQRVFNRVIEFLERTAPRPETTKEAWRVQQHNRDGISEAIGQIMHGQFPEGEEAHLSESFKIRGPNDRDCSLYCNIHFNPDGTIDFNRFNILSVGRVPEPTSVSGILVELRPYPPENDITRRHYIPYRILKPNGDVERFQRQNWYEYWFQSEHFTQVRRIIDENPVLGLEIWKRDKRNDLPALSNSAEAPILTWPRPSGFKYGETIPDQDIHMALKLREDIATPVGSYPAQNIRAVSFVNLLRPFWDPIEFEGPGVESRFTTNPDHGLSFQTRISDPKRIRPIGLLATNTQFYLRRNGQAYEIRQGDVLREPRMIRKAFNWLLGPALHPTRINDGSPLGLKWSPLNSGDKIRFGKSELIWTEPTL